MENQIALSNVVFDLVGLFKSVITRRHHTGIGHFLDIVNLSSHQIMLSCSSDPFCWLEEMSCLSTDVHPCLHTWAKPGAEVSYFHHSLLHRFFIHRKQLKMSFLHKKSHFQCQFPNQTGEKMIGHFKLDMHLPMSQRANPL